MKSEKYSYFSKSLNLFQKVKHKDLILSLIIALTVLWWTRPDNAIIYGQDSYNFFINVYGPSINPLILYSIGQGWITNISFGTSYPFLALSYVVSFFLNPAYVERFILMILIFLQTYGLLRVFSTLGEIDGKDSGTAIKLASVLFYLANPFTLTVTLWHFEAWIFPMVLLPYWISVILETLYFDNIRRGRLFQTIALSIFLVPGVINGWVTIWLYLSLMSILFLIYFTVSKKWNLRMFFTKLKYLIVLPAATLLWSNIPTYIYFFIMHPVSTFSPPTYRSAFLGQTKYSSIINILSGLNASGWPTLDIRSYGWQTGFWNILMAASLIIILILFIGLLYVKKNRVLILFYIISVPVLILSFEDNFPFGYINSFLLHLGGLFLILVNAYYFIGFIYILSLAVIIYYVLSDSYRYIAAERTKEKPDISRTKEISGSATSRLRNTIFQKKTIPHMLVICAVVVLVSVPAYPLVSSTQYSVHDNSANMFVIPPDLEHVSSFIHASYEGPYYYVLILPMSDSNSYPLEFNGNSLYDTSNMLSYLSPYPIIDYNASYYDSQLFNFLWSMNYSSLATVFQVLHIKYVLFNSYFQRNYSPSLYPEGGGNMSSFLNYTYDNLQNNIGPPIKFGSLSLFTIPGTIPIAYPTSNISFVNTETFRDYLNFLSELNYNSNNSDSFENLIWENNSSLDSNYNSITPIPFNGLSVDTEMLNSTAVDLLGNGGSIENIWNKDSSTASTYVDASNGTLHISPENLYSTNINLTNGLGTYSQKLIYNLTVNSSGKYLIDVNLSDLELANNSWNYWGIIFEDGNYKFEISFNGNPTLNSYYYNLQAFYNGNQYAWDYIHGSNYTNYFSGNDLMYIYLGPESFHFELTSTTSDLTTNSPVFYFAPSLSFHDYGYNTTLSNTLVNSPPGDNISLSMFLAGIEGTISGLNVYSSLPYDYVILMHGNISNSPTLNYSLAQNQQGDIQVNVQGIKDTSNVYVILGLLSSSLWTVNDGSLNSERLNITSYENIFVFKGITGSTHISLGITTKADFIYLSYAVPIVELVVILLYFLFDWKKKHRFGFKGKREA